MGSYVNFFLLCLFVSLGVILISFSFFSVFGHFSLSLDYFFHWDKINGKCNAAYQLKDCLTYPGLYHRFMAFAVGSELGFFLINVFLLFILIPLIIFLFSKSIFSALIYFSSWFPFYVMFNGVFAQGFLTVWFALFFLLDNWVARVLLTVLAVLTHERALWVFLPLWGYFLLKEVLDWEFVPFVLFWGVSSVSVLLSDLVKLMPLPNYLLALRLEPLKIALLLAFLGGALFVRDLRPLLFIPVMLSLWLPEVIDGLDFDFKTVLGWSFLFSVLAQLAIFYFDLFALQ